MWARLALNSQRSACVWLLSVGIKGACHYTEALVLILSTAELGPVARAYNFRTSKAEAEDQECKPSLGHLVSLRPSLDTWDCLLKKKSSQFCWNSHIKHTALPLQCLYWCLKAEEATLDECCIAKLSPQMSEMVQWVKLAAKPDDRSSIPRTCCKVFCSTQKMWQPLELSDVIPTVRAPCLLRSSNGGAVFGDSVPGTVLARQYAARLGIYAEGVGLCGTVKCPVFNLTCEIETQVSLCHAFPGGKLGFCFPTWNAGFWNVDRSMSPGFQHRRAGADAEDICGVFNLQLDQSSSNLPSTCVSLLSLESSTTDDLF